MSNNENSDEFDPPTPLEIDYMMIDFSDPILPFVLPESQNGDIDEDDISRLSLGKKGTDSSSSDAELFNKIFCMREEFDSTYEEAYERYKALKLAEKQKKNQK